MNRPAIREPGHPLLSESENQTVDDRVRRLDRDVSGLHGRIDVSLRVQQVRCCAARERDHVHLPGGTGLTEARWALLRNPYGHVHFTKL